MQEPPEAWGELDELSRLVLELARVVTGLLEAHSSVTAGQGHELIDRARDLHHRIQGRSYAVEE